MGDVHLKGLKSWQKPFIEELNFTCKDLSIFLPKGNMKVGDAWDVVLPISSRYGKCCFILYFCVDLEWLNQIFTKITY